MYPGDEYPPYIHGVAYLMSTYVAEKLYNQSFQNEFIHLEDVYITGSYRKIIFTCQPRLTRIIKIFLIYLQEYVLNNSILLL